MTAAEMRRHAAAVVSAILDGDHHLARRLVHSEQDKTHAYLGACLIIAAMASADADELGVPAAEWWRTICEGSELGGARVGRAGEWSP